MKVLISSLSLVLFGALSAYAQPLTCNDSTRPNGLILNVADDHASAVLTRLDASGPLPVEFGDLTCRSIPAPSRGGDMMTPFLECISSNVADAGYSVVLSEGGIWNHVSAEISAETFSGPQLIESELLCQ